MNILVVCHGNVCRSPLAEVVLRKNLPKTAIVSAGFAGPNRPAAKKVREYAMRHDYDLSQHRSKVVTQEQLQKSDLILYMDNRNLEGLRQMSCDIRKTMSLGSLVDVDRIQDPAYIPRGKKLDNILGTIEQACKNLAAFITKKDPRFSTRVY